MSAYAQTGVVPASAGRIGLVNTLLFLEDKPGAGISKLKTAAASLDAEFKSVNDELKTMATQYQTLGEEINKLRAAPTVPSNITAKITQFQDLETNIKRKQEDAKAKYERRQDQVVGPIYNDILKAMNEFAKAKGYALILDGARLEQAQILLGFDDKYDVTREFITYYNARPATAATAAVPK